MKRRLFNSLVALAAAASLALASPAAYGASPRQANTGMDPAMREFMQKQQKKTAEYTQKQEAAADEFMRTLAGKDRETKLAAIKEFKAGHYKENCDFRAKMHSEMLSYVEEQMASQNAPQAARDKVKARIDAGYADFKAFHEKKNAENMEFLDKMIADKTKDGEELDKILKEFFESQKKDAKEFLEKKREGIKGAKM